MAIQKENTWTRATNNMVLALARTNKKITVLMKKRIHDAIKGVTTKQAGRKSSAKSDDGSWSLENELELSHGLACIMESWSWTSTVTTTRL